jgi:hypothetical protein
MPDDLEIGENCLDDFFCEHLYILDGVKVTLDDIASNSRFEGKGGEIAISHETLRMLARVAERALSDLRDRIDLVDSKIELLRVAAFSNDADKEKTTARTTGVASGLVSTKQKVHGGNGRPVTRQPVHATQR